MASISVTDILKRILRSLRRNWGLKLISLLFAVILWNYVVMEVDPYRPASFSVPITPAGLTTLKNNNLTVSDMSKYIKNVNVVVELRHSEAATFRDSNIQVTADFSNISHEGKIEIILKPTTSRGTVSVKSVTPQSITVDIEKRDIRNVPVECTYQNELSGDYWRSEAEYAKMLQITGPASEIQKVARAELVFDLNGVTQSLSRALDYTLYDDKNNVITNTVGLEYKSNDIVSLTVLKTKTVPIDAQGSLIGDVTRGYHVVNAISDPGSIVIAGTEAQLEKIDSLKTAAINIDGAANTMSFTTQVKLPPGIRVAVPGSDTVEVAVTIAEKMATKTLHDLNISITGLGSGLTAGATFTADAVVTYPELIASRIRASKIRLFADATGLAPGAHTLTVYYELADDIDSAKITVELSKAEIAVQIKPVSAP